MKKMEKKEKKEKKTYLFFLLCCCFLDSQFQRVFLFTSLSAHVQNTKDREDAFPAYSNPNLVVVFVLEISPPIVCVRCCASYYSLCTNWSHRLYITKMK